MPRYIREGDERIAAAIARVRRTAVESNRPTGTERQRTAETAVQAALDSEFAKQLAEQLELELGQLPGQIQTALDEAANALAEAGLARSEAAAAVSAAQDAVADAATAISEAQAAAQAAAEAQTAADGKSTVVRSTSPATGAGSYKQGDQWWQFSGANIVGLWLHSGSAWVAQALTNAIIATLDAGKITTGTLAADRIGALSITTAKLAAQAITTEKIAALAVTASELAAGSVVATKIAANAVTAEKINAGAVTTVKLDALAVTAEKIAAGAIIADKIAANAIVAGKIAANALDAMTITGATIRTAVSGQRMQFDVNGLRAFNSANVVTASIFSETGGMAVQGRFSIRSSSEPGGIEMEVIDANGPRLVISGAPGTRGIGYLYAGAANSTNNKHLAITSPAANDIYIGAGEDLTLRSNDLTHLHAFRQTRVTADNDIFVNAPLVTLQAGISGSNVASILMDGASGGKISLNAAKVEFQGDRPWARIDSTAAGTAVGYLGSGVTHYVAGPYDGLRARIKGGVLYVTGAIQRTGGFPANYVIFTFNTGFRPGAAAVQYAYAGGDNFIAAQPADGTVIVALTTASPIMYLGLTIPLD